MPRIDVLALDLEGTLISNAVSQIPRPGLYPFLERCRGLFPRIVMFTTVREDRFRTIARGLVEEGYAPSWFADVEYVNWHGKTKDLNFVPAAPIQQIILVDDFEIYVHPGQESQWIRIDCFDHPYDPNDAGLGKVLRSLEVRLNRDV